MSRKIIIIVGRSCCRDRDLAQYRGDNRRDKKRPWWCDKNHGVAAAIYSNLSRRRGMRAKIKKSWPISRVLSWTAIHLGCTSPYTSSNLPGNSAGRTIVPLFGLAPGGVFPATPVTSRAVRSYRTISPLPAPYGTSAVYFLWHFP